MSAIEQRTQSAHTFLNATQKQALIAAVAAGMSQRDAAAHFNVHRNTVTKLMKSVKDYDSPANPLNKDWKSRARTAAQQAVMDGLQQRKDVVSAAHVGLKVLYGMGDLSTSVQHQVEGNVNVTFSWASAQEESEPAVIEADCAIDVDSQPITSDPT